MFYKNNYTCILRILHLKTGITISHLSSMRSFIQFCILCFACFTCSGGYAQNQNSPADSLSLLIRQEKDPDKKADLILQRAVQYPAEAADKAITEAGSILRYYQGRKNREGEAASYISLSHIHHKKRDYTGALHYDSLALTLSQNIQYTKGIAQASGNMGREQQATGKLKESQKSYQQALDLELSMSDKDTDRILRCQNQLGIINRILGVYQSSLDYFDQGILLAKEQHKDHMLAILYMNKANTLAETSRFDEAAALHLASIRIKEQLPDQSDLDQSFNNLAVVFKGAREYDKAIQYYEKSRTIALKNNNYRSLGMNANNLAITYIEKGEKQGVDTLFKQAIGYFSKIADIRGQGLSYHNYGNFLFDEGKTAAAATMMEKALRLRREVGSNTEISSSLSNLGKLKLRNGDIPAAEAYLLEAERRLNTADQTSYLKNVYASLKDLYAAKADFKKAFDYQGKYVDLEKDQFTESKRINLLKAASVYELEKRDLQLALEKEEQQDKRNQIIAFAAFIIMLLAVLSIVLLLRRKQVRERHRAQLHSLSQQHRLDTVRNLKDAQEQERRNIANKLHDEVGAILSITRLNISQLHDNVFAADSDATGKLQTAQKLLGDMSETVRSISHTLMPVALEKYGLKPALLDLLSSIRTANCIQAEDVIEGMDHTDSWGNDFCLSLYRIVQEILNNIIKHAQATHILVQIIELDKSVTIYIEDNGKGIESAAQTTGQGLKLLKSNVAYLEGIIEINGQANQGTFVLIELPLPTERNQEKTKKLTP